MWLTDGYYAEINTTGNNFETGTICALQFKTVWGNIHSCLTSREHKRFGRTVLRILCNLNILRGGENYAKSTVLSFENEQPIINNISCELVHFFRLGT